ncbi:MAG: hypothetical protein NTV35_10430 [Chloroflexi bacterium]|nr:hypothetical protein [Chloroflexota bacterium]
MNHHQGTERPTISYTLDGTLLGMRGTAGPLSHISQYRREPSAGAPSVPSTLFATRDKP